MVRVRRESRIDGTELVLNANTVHRLAPVAQSHVRGTLNGLHLIEPHEDGCVYTMVSQMDPKGSIPMVIVNWFAMRRPLQYMVALRDLAEARYARADSEEVVEAARAEADDRPRRRASSSRARRSCSSRSELEEGDARPRRRSSEASLATGKSAC